MSQLTAFLNTLNALPGSTVTLNVSASPEAGKLTLSCFHSLEADKCLLTQHICSSSVVISIPDDWEAGMYKLSVSGENGTKWEGILGVRPQDVDLRSITGARALPSNLRQASLFFTLEQHRT